MTKVITIIDGKGGTGKTTSCVELAYHAATELGLKVLCVDLDQQSNLTKMLTGETYRYGVFDLLVAESWAKPASDVIVPALPAWQNTFVLPADRRLGTVSAHLAGKVRRDYILRDLLKPIKHVFDIILIDLPPDLGLLAMNALACSDSYFIPVDLSEYSRGGVKDAKELADIIRAEGINPTLEFAGVVVNAFQTQKGGAKVFTTLLADLAEDFQGRLSPHKIPHSVRVPESQRANKPVGVLDPQGTVSMAFKAIAREMFV